MTNLFSDFISDEIKTRLFVKPNTRLPCTTHFTDLAGEFLFKNAIYNTVFSKDNLCLLYTSRCV